MITNSPAIGAAHECGFRAAGTEQKREHWIRGLLFVAAKTFNRLLNGLSLLAPKHICIGSRTDQCEQVGTGLIRRDSKGGTRSASCIVEGNGR